MNGATELPPPMTIKKPINIKIIITGANQNLRRSFIKSKKSFKNSINYFLHVPKLSPFILIEYITNCRTLLPMH